MTVKEYLKSCDGIYHTTLDPNGPGVVRIHLIPPKKLKPGIPWVVIINGYSILPVQTAWAILLREFILELNKTEGRELEDKDIDELITIVVSRIKAIYTDAKEKDIKADLKEIIGTFTSIARGKEPNSEIGFMKLSDYGKHMKAPHRMDLMVSSMKKRGCWNCNQKCLLCYAGEEKLAVVDEMSTECWYSIIDKCKEACIPSLTFTGGEPTMRDDLVDLISYASWFVTRLNTNGIKLNKELCYKLAQASLDSVQITLYSHDEAIHNKMVGGNHFRQTVEGIKNAVDAGLDVSINTPLCSVNSDYVETVKFAHNLGVNYFSCSGLIPTGNAIDTDIKVLTSEEILQCVKDAYSYTSQNGLEIAFTSPGWIKGSELKKMKIVVPSCGAALSNMAIAPNGEVIPCQSWLHEEGLGNLLKLKFSNIWNDKRTKTLRKNSMKNLEVCPLKEVKR